MASSNWLELAALLAVAAAGTAIWLLCRRKLQGCGGFEGIVKERGKPPLRRRMDVEEEIARLESVLGKK